MKNCGIILKLYFNLHIHILYNFVFPPMNMVGSLLCLLKLFINDFQIKKLSVILVYLLLDSYIPYFFVAVNFCCLQQRTLTHALIFMLQI